MLVIFRTHDMSMTSDNYSSFRALLCTLKPIKIECSMHFSKVNISPEVNSTRHAWLWSIFRLSSGMKSMTQRYRPIKSTGIRVGTMKTMSPDGWIYPMILGESYKQYAGAARLKRRSRHRQRITDLWTDARWARIELMPSLSFQHFFKRTCRYLGVLILPNEKQASPANDTCPDICHFLFSHASRSFK